ncbi:50S ribosomal protein L23 [Desulfomonile tiedjei]|uniref:Large ribosomal subunit protein uL23 n=1 Tax=Desulfomonile tiedjei (strain ATCC 49306 / DSM 6799 / DCB-1) TaxID=706587 RepID=I4CE63_DESTA|nr:50S ribosomal protein L23 [Desulfomonile tiedjei]AFM27854.1 ribosomal protein L23 [Desulfomonile tiedjei DSM 6799]
MLEEYAIIRRPIITEKGSGLKDDNNQLIFEVHPGSNKSEIKKAVEKLFKVTVLSVRTQNRLGKRKRLGRTVGRRKHWKKAIVTLKEGDRVEFFEGV